MMEPSDAASLGFAPDRLARIGGWMARYVDAGKLPCGLTLVARRGEVAYLDSVGRRDVEAGVPVAEDTIFRIYSMTKPVTTVAMMMLYEEGLFRLNDPLKAYLPEFSDMQVWVAGAGADMELKPAREAMTIGHLLTHTAGLTYGLTNDTPVSALYLEERLDLDPQDGPLAGRVERMAAMPLIAHPGDRWAYSVSFDVLGRLAEVLSGQPFDRFLAERIFKPLGMADTGFQVPQGEVGRFAALYNFSEGGGFALAESPADSVFVKPVTCHSGGGGLLSTVEDYYRFAEMMRRGGAYEGVRLLGRKTVEFMTANHLPDGCDLAAMGQSSFSETSYKWDRLRLGDVGHAGSGQGGGDVFARRVRLGRGRQHGLLDRPAGTAHRHLHDPASSFGQPSPAAATAQPGLSGAGRLNRRPVLIVCRRSLC